MSPETSNNEHQNIVSLALIIIIICSGAFCFLGIQIGKSIGCSYEHVRQTKVLIDNNLAHYTVDAKTGQIYLTWEPNIPVDALLNIKKIQPENSK